MEALFVIAALIVGAAFLIGLHLGSLFKEDQFTEHEVLVCKKPHVPEEEFRKHLLEKIEAKIIQNEMIETRQDEDLLVKRIKFYTKQKQWKTNTLNP